MQLTLATCLLSALAALASAYTPANTAQPPSGNPIGHPELGELIPAGQSYTITWAPDTGDLVTLLLLRGPSTNVVPILTIAESIPNTGSYVWSSVPSSLEPDTTGYGIQLIVEGSGAYQYSPQCGVKNDAYTPTTSSSSSGSGSGSDISSSITVTLVSASTTESATATATPALTYVTYATASGTGGNFSVPVLTPTNTMSVPSTLQSTFANTRSASRAASGTEEVAVATGAAAPAVKVVGAGAGVGLMAVAVVGGVFAF